ncbi:MAG: hypothetical protein KGO80_03450 [Bacteroidetes bacterium]|nr:hypothetical protein [Bacteroidota bacterium]
MQKDMMTLYFHIDELGRDAIVASALNRIGKEHGVTVVYGNRKMTRLIKHINFFDAIILPSILHFKQYFPRLDQIPSNVFILPTEAVGQATQTLGRINAKYFGNDQIKDEPWHRAVKGFLLWGSDHLLSFKNQHDSYLQKCSVVGHPRLSSYCIAPHKRNSSNDGKICIGFVSRFGEINTFDGRSNFDFMYGGMRYFDYFHPKFDNSPDHLDVEDILYTELIDFRIFLTIIDMLNPDRFEFFVRPHPRENAFQWESFLEKHGINAQVSDRFLPFTSWLSKVDIIVSPPSTSFYDILSQGRTVICIDKIITKRAEHIFAESDDRNVILDYIYRPTSFKEVVDVIESFEVPEPQVGFENIIAGQVKSTMQDDPIINILNLVKLSKSVSRTNLEMKFWLSIFFISSFLFTLLSMLKNIGVRQQGSNFQLTPIRKRWINKLSFRVTGGSV